MKTVKTYYRPILYTDDGTNIGWGGSPEELGENEYFESKKECREWLKEYGYNPDDYVIEEYDEDDFDEDDIIEVI